MSCYKLHSFTEIDPGEVIRCILHYSGQEFEDVRVKRSEWPKLKRNTPCGQLPVLEMPDGKKLAGSLPIARFLGQKIGMAGDNEWDRAQLDSICDLVHDTIAVLSRYWSENDPYLKERKKAEILGDGVPQRLAIINQRISDNSNPEGFVYGDRASYADFFIHFLFCEVLTRVYPKEEQRCEADKYPEVGKLCKTLRSHPDVKKYLDSRQPTVSWDP